jgi:hypothetical protein
MQCDLNSNSDQGPGLGARLLPMFESTLYLSLERETLDGALKVSMRRASSTVAAAFLVASPVATSHSLTVLSADFNATVFPLGENATAVTRFSCPSSFRVSLPVAASHNLTVLSSDPEGTILLSGANVTILTAPPAWAQYIEYRNKIALSNVLYNTTILRSLDFNNIAIFGCVRSCD